MYIKIARQHSRKLLQLAMIGFLTSNSAVFADDNIVIPTKEEARQVNNNTVGVVFTHEELFHQLVHNMEDALEHSAGLRIVPIMGKNHVQSIYDLLYLKGVDLALVRADAIEYVRTEGNENRVQNFIKSVAKVSEEKIVIIARKEYKTVEDLEGQLVSQGVQGSGEYVTSTVAFRALGIKPEFLQKDISTAIEQMKNGELAAMIYLLREPDAVQTGKDLQAANAVKNILSGEELHLLELPVSDVMSRLYTPSTLSANDLPRLINDGESITTYSVDAILAAYGWGPSHPRHQRATRFVIALVDGLTDLASNAYQPAWKRVKLGRSTPNVEQSSILLRTIEKRLNRDQQLAEKEKLAIEEAESKAAKMTELKAKRDEITERLGKELSKADIIQLERMLDELNVILESSE